jgi:riboflavin synthase
MFTGLIEDLGTVTSIESFESASRIEVETELASQLTLGASIAVNGVCLTVTNLDENSFTADLMIQTLKLSSLKEISVGSRVNLELAASMQTRLGGHLVQGHVDGVGKVTLSKPGEKWHQFVVAVEKRLLRYIVNQGSITVDGVSLTVGEVKDETQEVTLWLIPETLARTNLGMKKIDDLVNIEVDIMAKYVERILSFRGKEEIS